MNYVLVYCGVLAATLVLYGVSSAYGRGGSASLSDVSLMNIDATLSAARDAFTGSKWRWLIVCLGIACIVLTGCTMWRAAYPAPDSLVPNWVLLAFLIIFTVATIIVVLKDAVATTKAMRDMPGEVEQDVTDLLAKHTLEIVDTVALANDACRAEKEILEAKQKQKVDDLNAQVTSIETQHKQEIEALNATEKAKMEALEQNVRQEEKAECQTANALLRAQHGDEMAASQDERARLHEFTEKSIRKNAERLSELEAQLDAQIDALSMKDDELSVKDAQLKKSQKRRRQAHEKAAAAAESQRAEAAARIEKLQEDKVSMASTIRDVLRPDYEDPTDVSGELLEVE